MSLLDDPEFKKRIEKYDKIINEDKLKRYNKYYSINVIFEEDFKPKEYKFGEYDLETNLFIDKIFVGDSPALMAFSDSDHKLYISRMMPMGSMMTNSISTVVQEIDYSDSSKMELSNEFSIDSPAPHGLAINSIGTEVYVASNTADWIYKIIIEDNTKVGEVMDLSVDNSPEIITLPIM